MMRLFVPGPQIRSTAEISTHNRRDVKSTLYHSGWREAPLYLRSHRLTFRRDWSRIINNMYVSLRVRKRDGSSSGRGGNTNTCLMNAKWDSMRDNEVATRRTMGVFVGRFGVLRTGRLQGRVSCPGTSEATHINHGINTPIRRQSLKTIAPPRTIPAIDTIPTRRKRA